MVKKKADKNLISIIIGAIFILIGLAWTSIIINSSDINNSIIISGAFLILGAILALMGGLGKWGS